MDEYNHDKFENAKTSKSLPLGWVILAVCLLGFGIYYFFAYTPGLSEWSQQKAYEESIK